MVVGQKRMYIGECKTIKVAARSARLSRHVTQECTANFQWCRKSSENVNKDFLVVRFRIITRDYLSWRRYAKMKIRCLESAAQKKWKNSLFRFPKQEECTSTEIFKKIFGFCKSICSKKYITSSLHVSFYIISDHYHIFTAACTVCTLIVVYIYILKWFSTSLEICCTFLSDMPAKASGASCNFNCLGSGYLKLALQGRYIHQLSSAEFSYRVVKICS